MRRPTARSFSFVSLVCHIIFSTRNLLPMLRAEIRDELHAYTGGVAHNLKSDDGDSL
jgi:hypothetical protein